MSTNDEEPQMMSDGPYPGMWTEEHAANLAAESVSYLTDALDENRRQLDIKRRARKRLKAALEIARAREAAGPLPIPANPGWANFAFNFQLPGDNGQVYPATGHQCGGKISVVAAPDFYWFFDCWDDLILWMRDTEKVASVSRMWKLVADHETKTVTVR